jgi:hypothetical protein
MRNARKVLLRPPKAALLLLERRILLEADRTDNGARRCRSFWESSAHQL